MDLVVAQRHALLGQVAGSVVINFLLNGALAWVTSPPGGMPAFARGPCVATDVTGTCFCLPFITCLMLTPAVRRAVRKGAIPRVPRASLPAVARFLPASLAGRGATLGILCVLTVGDATLGALAIAGVAAMSRVDLVVFKAIYTAIFGAPVTAILGLRALSDA